MSYINRYCKGKNKKERAEKKDSASSRIDTDDVGFLTIEKGPVGGGYYGRIAIKIALFVAIAKLLE